MVEEKKSILSDLVLKINEIYIKMKILEERVMEIHAEITSQKKAENLAGHLEAPEKTGIELQYGNRFYKRFTPCKYKCGLMSSWADDYKKGDRKLHYNPVTKEIFEDCPKYAGG